ncbi:MAG: hypothetical protein ACJ798_13030 [Phenylobacterium sp.]
MTPETAQDDLAYLRALVQGTDSLSRAFGQAYAAAGLCYGVQFLLHGGQALGWVPDAGFAGLAIGLGPTVVFLALLAWIVARSPKDASGGVTSRAVRSAFSAVGLANVAAAAVVGSVALRQHSLTIWLIFPCIVMVFQGAAWWIAWVLRRRGWFALVATGWIAAGIAAALCIEVQAAYLGVSGLAFLLLMLLPGVVMARSASGRG